MSYPKILELSVKSDGPRYRRVSLSLRKELGLSLVSLDLSTSSIANDDNEDFELRVSPEALGELAFALAAHLLKGGECAVGRMRRICEEFDIPHQTADYN